LPKTLWEKLEVMREKEENNLIDVIKIGLGRLKIKSASENGISDEALSEDYRVGFLVPKKRLTLCIPVICSGLVVVGTSAEKDATCPVHAGARMGAQVLP
jgi:hypothetical protein